MKLAWVVILTAVIHAEDAKTQYPKMAPLDQYMMEQKAEIELARSAAPPSISQDAEVMVLGRHGYVSVAKGKNGFVCMVERAGHWHPHLMFFFPPTDAASWGAGLAGSPIIVSDETEGRVTVFMVPVGQWSDGTPDSQHEH